MPALREKVVRSLYVCGNSYSATDGGDPYGRWPGMLSRRLGFAFVQANNSAQASAGLFRNKHPPRPGLRDQVAHFPTTSKVKALLVIWLFPDPASKTSVWVPVYTEVMDRCVRTLGFRMILMPNYPDVTKTAYALARHTATELAVIRQSFIRFNASYASMVNSWRRRYPNLGPRFAVVDMFKLWDCKGTVPDGLHPNKASHRLFASWFLMAVKENFLPA